MGMALGAQDIQSFIEAAESSWNVRKRLIGRVG
jgi:hypothetical protein